MNTGKCQTIGCRNMATCRAHKLFGKGGHIDVCETCKPDPDKRPASLRHLPFFYRIEPLTATVSR